MASSWPSEAATGGVTLEGFGYRHADAARPSLRGVDLHLRRGECALVTGATGSGKTTLLRAIAGVLPPGGSSSGRIATGGRPALLLQNVETQLLFTTVEEEVASGLRGEAAARAARVRSLLDRVGLAGCERRSVDALSAGEKQRVALAALLALEPALLLLDEPTSALDPAGRRRLARLLASFKRRGHTLVIADHVTGPFRGLADRHWVLKEGCASEGWIPPEPGAGAFDPSGPRPGSTGEVVCCDSLEVRDAEGRTLLAGASLRLARGGRLLVTGPNGSGKTTLLRALASLVPPSSGRLRVAGAVGLLFQDPQRNLFERSVAEEIAFPLRRAGWSAAATQRRVEQMLALCGLESLRGSSPLRLSAGEQHRVAIASVLAPRPALLLLDEPFSGLDSEARAKLLDLLAREQESSAMAILLASHDEDPLSAWADACVRLQRAESHGARRRERRGRDGARARRRLALPGRAFHYRDTGSPLHRLGAATKLGLVAAACAAAVAATRPAEQALLLAGLLAGYRLARLSASELWQDARWLVLQGLLVTALSFARDGAPGLARGLCVAAQIALFFLPGALALRTTSARQWLAAARRVLPARLSFAVTASLRFVAYFARELHEIVGGQRLRGALLAPRSLWRPRAWRDWSLCVGVPLAVRIIHTAGEAALAAEIRGVVGEGPPIEGPAAAEERARWRAGS